MLQLLKLPDGTVKVLVEGGQRARIVRYAENPDFFQAYAETMDEHPGEEGEPSRPWRATVVGQFEQYVKLNKKIPPEVLVSINQIEEPSKLADTLAAHMTIKIPEKQELLEIDKVSERLGKVYSPSWKARSASSRSRSGSGTGSSARWRRPSASTT